MKHAFCFYPKKQRLARKRSRSNPSEQLSGVSRIAIEPYRVGILRFVSPRSDERGPGCFLGRNKTYEEKNDEDSVHTLLQWVEGGASSKTYFNEFPSTSRNRSIQSSWTGSRRQFSFQMKHHCSRWFSRISFLTVAFVYSVGETSK